MKKINCQKTIKNFQYHNTSISVLMANFNKSEYIAEAIISVVGQSYKNWELVIVDDASMDNSIAAVKPFLKDSRIKLFQNSNNLGYIKTLKKLIAESKYVIIGILDSDDALAPNALEEIAKAYCEHPDCGLIYSQCVYCDSDLNPAHKGYSAAIPEGKSNLHCNSVVAFRTFKKEAYEQAGGYDGKMLYAEDIDLTLRIEEKAKLLFIDKELYFYRVLPKSQTHGFINAQINRSSSALAKYRAYQRRLNSAIPNLDKTEASLVLFLGIITSFLSFRLLLFSYFVEKLFLLSPFFFLNYKFYLLLSEKIKKQIKIYLHKY